MGASAIQARAMAAGGGGSCLFALPGSTGAWRDLLALRRKLDDLTE
jgi:molybdopterin biosynthesis enzyme MoaB